MEDVGFILYSRRLHLDLTQPEIAAETSRIMGREGAVTKVDISRLEDGVLQGAFKAQGYVAVDALLDALDWRGDRNYVRHMLHEFARIV
jgi:hypothetical protein